MPPLSKKSGGILLWDERLIQAVKSPCKHSNGELTFSPASLALAKAIHARPSQFTLLPCLHGFYPSECLSHHAQLLGDFFGRVFFLCFFVFEFWCTFVNLQCGGESCRSFTEGFLSGLDNLFTQGEVCTATHYRADAEG